MPLHNKRKFVRMQHKAAFMEHCIDVLLLIPIFIKHDINHENNAKASFTSNFHGNDNCAYIAFPWTYI